MNKIFLVVVMFLLTAMMAFSFGSKEKTVPANFIQVTGTVRLVGTGLFNDIVLMSEDNQWYIAKEEKDKLHQYQHQTVTVEGEETVRELKFANGMSAGLRRELRNIRIISE